MSLVAVNNLIQKFNPKQHTKSKMCLSCYDMIHNNVVVSVDLNSQVQIVFLLTLCYFYQDYYEIMTSWKQSLLLSFYIKSSIF